MMATKTTPAHAAGREEKNEREAARLFGAMHAMAWIALGIGVLLCLSNIRDFSDQNLMLMIGIGFLVGSVHIYVIGTAIRLVHKRKDEAER